MIDAKETPTQRADRPGLVIVYTGEGKGKTTAALGLALRASGYGLKVIMLQFIKGTWKTGELESAKLLHPNFKLTQLGIGFVTWRPRRPYEAHKEAAESAWRSCREIVLSDEYDIVIMDEINNATRFGLISVEEVLKLIQEKPKRLHLVLTGRGADPRIMDAADLVTEMKMVKHPFEKGMWAVRGIDF